MILKKIWKFLLTAWEYILLVVVGIASIFFFTRKTKPSFEREDERLKEEQNVIHKKIKDIEEKKKQIDKEIESSKKSVGDLKDERGNIDVENQIDEDKEEIRDFFDDFADKNKRE